jgi:hypothetical protein
LNPHNLNEEGKKGMEFMGRGRSARKRSGETNIQKREERLQLSGSEEN